MNFETQVQMNIGRPGFLNHLRRIALPLILLAFMVLGRQAQADSMSVSETWKDNSIVSSSDSGTFSASLTIPGLQNFTTATWSNLLISLDTSNMNTAGFADIMGDANTNLYGPGSSFSGSSATFVYQMTDTNGNQVNAFKLTFSRSGNTLSISGQTQNPASAQPPWSIVAENYLFTRGATNDPDICEVILLNDGSPYADIIRTIPITAINTESLDAQSNILNNITASGSADFTPPTLTAVSPSSTTLTTTNGLLPVTVKATDASGIANVEFYVNGQDFGSGIAGVSNLWSQNLALSPGVTTIKEVATDNQFNVSTNTLTVTYVNGQTNANEIVFSEHFLNYSNVVYSGGATPVVQDAGVLDAALTVPALQTMTADTWSNLFLAVNFGGFQFSSAFVGATSLTTNTATFQFLASSPPTEQYLTATRVGAKLLVTVSSVNPTYASDVPFIAGIYYSEFSSAIKDQQPFNLTLMNGSDSTVYTNLTRTIYISGTNSVGLDGVYSLDNIQISGAADFTPPTNQITAPLTGQQWSNNTFVVTGKAGDNHAVSNVVYSLNGSDWTPVVTGNAFTNWIAPINLVAGTNTIVVYAYDYDNNYSITNTVSFRYIPSSTIALSTNGLGTLSPNYAGAMLGISNTYSITASPASGFIFSNWSGSTNVNSATLTFQMQSNLSFTVNFVDVTRPTLSITNLTAGQQISNAAFTVRGVAADNWKVTNVWYQLNSGGWNNANTVNNRTNWNAPLALVPGTNTIQVFAQDQGGNNSLTNTVNFAYIVSSRLQIQLNGVGTLSPNYSNTLLAVGQNYNITATPGSGFIFTNWTVSTNWVGGRIVNTASLPFTMASNLTLLANFVDIARPTLTITSPTANQRMTNALAYVTGTAGDNWKVAGVWYQFNNGFWMSAPTTNNWTNWNTTLALPAGTNSLAAYALDLGGNYSLTSSISFFSSNTFQLQLAFDTNTPLAANGLHFNLLVSTNLRGHVQYSTNLLSWATLTNFNGTNSTLKFNDSAATNVGRRFYRAVIP